LNGGSLQDVLGKKIDTGFQYRDEKSDEKGSENGKFDRGRTTSLAQEAPNAMRPPKPSTS
jgi:hypothetical protein